MQAIKENYEVVVCDTSGRLHTNAVLMEELAKCKRAVGKRLPGAPHETLLVLDGTTGHGFSASLACMSLQNVIGPIGTVLDLQTAAAVLILCFLSNLQKQTLARALLLDID